MFASEIEGLAATELKNMKNSDVKPDNIDHPEHYQTKNGIETVDVIEAFTENLTGYEAVFTANALKYLCRWKKKNGIEDLRKANWYINRLIANLEKEKN